MIGRLGIDKVGVARVRENSALDFKGRINLVDFRYWHFRVANKLFVVLPWALHKQMTDSDYYTSR